MVIKGGRLPIFAAARAACSLRNAPIGRALPLFVLLMGYIFGALRELGLVADQAERPRSVVSVRSGFSSSRSSFSCSTWFAPSVSFASSGCSGWCVMRPTPRPSASASGLRAFPSIPGQKLALPLDATALVASDSGTWSTSICAGSCGLAMSAGVRVRICQAIGDYVDEGEVIGWASSDDGRTARRPTAAHTDRGHSR